MSTVPQGRAIWTRGAIHKKDVFNNMPKYLRTMSPLEENHLIHRSKVAEFHEGRRACQYEDDSSPSLHGHISAGHPHMSISVREQLLCVSFGLLTVIHLSQNETDLAVGLL
jgi:hypothetical protein